MASSLENDSLFLFDPLIGLIQVLQLKVRVNMESHDYEGVLLIPQSYRIKALPSDSVYCHIQDIFWRWSYPFAEIHPAYSTALANRLC